jgi:hypothetical protein
VLVPCAIGGLVCGVGARLWPGNDRVCERTTARRPRLTVMSCCWASWVMARWMVPVEAWYCWVSSRLVGSGLPLG